MMGEIVNTAIVTCFMTLTGLALGFLLLRIQGE
nr:cytochrome B6-f complex subunit [Erythrolobus coxiae]UNJ17690.1 cytochrome B6-f complex subunit [Erythrolobus coxiae]